MYVKDRILQLLDKSRIKPTSAELASELDLSPGKVVECLRDLSTAVIVRKDSSGGYVLLGPLDREQLGWLTPRQRNARMNEARRRIAAEYEQMDAESCLSGYAY